MMGPVMMMKLLYAEDEPALSQAVVEALRYYNFTVDPVYNGNDALDYALLGGYDGIILDIMMPGKDGLEVLRALRAAGSAVPVLLLTARSQVEDRIQGLDLGADDYLPKPFAMAELLARVRAMLRRKESFSPSCLRCGEIALDRNECTLSGGGKKFLLSKLEFQVMELLMLNQGRYLSTEEIRTKVWGYDSDAEVGVVWVYISYLRKRLAALGGGAEIRARRNVGYTLEAKK